MLGLVYIGYHGVRSIFRDPFLVQVNAKLDEFGATSDQRQEFSNRIIHELQKRKIGTEATIEFLQEVDFKMSTDPEVFYNSFMALAEKYAVLEKFVADLRTSSDVEIRTFSKRAGASLKGGDLENAEELMGAAQLKKTLLSEVSYDVIGDRVVFKNGGIAATLSR